MSATPENRWRRHSERPTPNNSGQQSRQQRQEPAQQSSQSQTAGTPQANAWVGGDRSRSGSGARTGNGPRAATPGNGGSAAGPSEESHVPLKDFNSSEIKEYLKQSSQNATIGDNGRKALWKPQGDSGNSKPSGPWGSKPTVMANGQDLWVQLTKQVAAKEAGG